MTSSSILAAISKGSAKRKVDGEDDHPPKKVAVNLGDAHPKKSPPKPGRSACKEMMTLTGPVIEGPRHLLTHKDYAVEELTDVDPCAELGIEELGASALFDLTRVNILSWLISSPFFSLKKKKLTTLLFFRPWFVLRHLRTGVSPRRGSSPGLGSTILIC